MLPELIREVCKVDGVHWVRILYCYPQRITDELLEVMASEPKVVKYMDVPVQHASGRVLKAMNRRDDYEYLRNLMQRIREKIPGVVLRTTFITGFPGETEEDFAEMTRLVKEVKFERLGCFTYSPEDGTPAYSMPDQIDEETKRRRADIVMSEQLAIAEEFARSWIGKELEVVVEGLNEETGIYYGRSYMDAPDIDTRIYFDSPYEHETGEYVMVTVTGKPGLRPDGGRGRINHALDLGGSCFEYTNKLTLLRMIMIVPFVFCMLSDLALNLVVGVPALCNCFTHRYAGRLSGPKEQPGHRLWHPDGSAGR